jgi:hypothetical protein
MNTRRSQDDVLDITLAPWFAWSTMGFGGLITVFGVLQLIPTLPRHNVPVGLFLLAVGAIVVLGGGIWLKNLPVMLRLTSERLEFLRTNRTPIRWIDIELVSERHTDTRQHPGYVCIKLRKDSWSAKQRGGQPPETKWGEVKGGFDVILSDFYHARQAQWLAREFKRRISLAMAREHLPDDARGAALACRGSGPEKIATAGYVPAGDGRFVAAYRPSDHGKYYSIGGGIVAILLGTVSCAMPLVRPPQPGEGVVIFLLFYCLGVPFLVGGLVAILAALLKRPRTFFIYPDRFLVQQGGATLVCKWEDVAVLRVRLEPGIFSDRLVDVIECGNGEVIEIDPLAVSNSDDLVDRIADAVGRELAPQAVQQLKAGKAVDFGSFVFTRAGVHVGRVFYPWKKIRAIGVDPATGGVFVDGPEGKKLTELTIVDVPNLPAISATVDSVRNELSRRQGRQTPSRPTASQQPVDTAAGHDSESRGTTPLVAQPVSGPVGDGENIVVAPLAPAPAGDDDIPVAPPATGKGINPAAEPPAVQIDQGLPQLDTSRTSARSPRRRSRSE